MKVKEKTSQTKAPRKKTNGQFSIAIRQFRRNKLAMIGLIGFLIIVLACIFAHWITPYDYAKQVPREKFAPLSWEHPFGTDQFGRDLLARLLYGGRISLLVGICAIAIGAAAGALLGCSAAYFGGKYEAVVMRIMDIFMSLPALLMAASIATVLGTGVWKSVVAISIAQIASMTRIMHSTALTVAGQDFLEAAHAIGASRRREILKHVLPNCLPSMVVQIAMRFGNCVTSVASLSFLGLGVHPPTPEWGQILNAGKVHIRSYPAIVIFPGLLLALTLICVNFIGDGLRDALDPRMKR